MRKDFTIDEYQIVEARSIGADAILLITAALAPQQIKDLAAFARSLALEVLIEIRDLSELPDNLENVSMVGVNNRDLRDFSVDINRSFEIVEKLPPGVVKISESGLSDPKAIVELKHAGFDGFLIGEAFMCESQPEAACAEFIRRVRASDAK